MESCETRVTATLASMQERFLSNNDTAPLEQAIQQNMECINACSNRRDLRRRNALTRSNEQTHREIQRRQRKRQLFDTLATDVREAVQIAEARARHRHRPSLQHQAGSSQRELEKSSKATADKFAEATRILMKDIILIDNGEGLQDARAQVDDICCNCGRLMERNLQLSYLVCPNLECGHMRWYMDTSTYSSSSYSSRYESIVKNAPKSTHYGTFLNAAQGKTTKQFPREFLMKICFYCFVEGARHRDDITKEMINKAQKYLGVTEYNISTILKTQLRGDYLRLPPEIVKKLQLLFKAMWPVFADLKRGLDTHRSNMINFNFVSRVLCRLLGYDVFLPLFDPFRMPPNEIKHSAFMRQMFRKLGWVWEDGRLSDVPDSVLDEFDAREGTEHLLGDDVAEDGDADEDDM